MTFLFGRPAAAAAIALALAGCRQTPAQVADAEPATEVTVTVTPIVRRTLHEFVDGWGRVEPEPAGTGHPAANARITSPVAGLISRIHVSEGQEVAAGALLIELDTRVADLAIERGRQALRVAEQVVARQDQLGPGEATSEKTYEEALAQRTAARADLAAAELQRRLLEVRAPMSGTVVSLAARLGDAIDPTTVMGELVDLHRLSVTASIRSVDAPRVSRGQRMDLLAPDATPSAAAASPGTATVDFIGPRVDTSSDTVIVRARPARAVLRPGQFVRVRILVGERTNCLAVPAESLVRGPSGTEIAVVEDGRATRIPVTVGIREAALVEVAAPTLRAGLPVVVDGAYGLPATSAVKVARP